jgi:hypothetical protein
MFGLVLLPTDYLSALTWLDRIAASGGAPVSSPPEQPPSPTVCGSCGAVKNEHGELPCGH